MPMGQKPDEDYKKVLKIYLVIIVLILLIIPLISLIFLNKYLGGMNVIWIYLIFMLITPILVYILFGQSFANKVFENYSFKLEETGIRIKIGIFTIREKFIPYNKIENLEITSGLIERHYGVSSIKIETAGKGMPYAEGTILGIRDPVPLMEEIRANMKKVS